MTMNIKELRPFPVNQKIRIVQRKMISSGLTMSRFEIHKQCSRRESQRLFHFPRLASHSTYPAWVGEADGIADRLNGTARGVNFRMNVFIILSLFHDAWTSARSSKLLMGRSIANNQKMMPQENHKVADPSQNLVQPPKPSNYRSRPTFSANLEPPPFQ